MRHSDLAEAGIHTHQVIDHLLPSQAEKHALLGSSGRPSEANRFLTQDDAPAVPAASRVLRLDDAGVLLLPGGGWNLGATPLDLDFTGTSYDAKAECQALGIRFSDADAPFPAELYGVEAGSWAHAAGSGWQPTSVVDNTGPALVVPLLRPGNWQLAAGLTYPAGGTNFRMVLGYLTGSNHCGAAAVILDDAAADSLRATLQTNDGDDTFTGRYSALSTLGAGTWTYKFRCYTGTVSVWDHYDDTWRNYTGRQALGRAYTPAYAFIQFLKTPGATFPTCYLSSLALTYLV
jgi:hypothetical protein